MIQNKSKEEIVVNNQINVSNKQTDVVLMQLPLWGMFHPPLALGLLKSHLGHNGISCKTFDVNAHVFSTRGKQYYDLWHLKHTFTEQFINLSSQANKLRLGSILITPTKRY